MKISVLLSTSSDRGDHAADISVAHDVRPGETVEDLVRRLLFRRRGGARVPEPIPSDHIELRVVVEPPETEVDR